MIGSLVSPGKVLVPTLKKKFDTQEILSNSFEIQLKQKLVEKSSTTEIFIMTNYYFGGNGKKIKRV